MPAEPVDRWLRSGKPARIEGLSLHPIAHRLLPDTPVSIQCGQAEAFPLSGDDEQVLKGFSQGKRLDGGYLGAVGRLLPKETGFRCGTDRRLLSARSLQNVSGHHYTGDLAQWLEGTVLMPRVPGCSWASLADEIREGTRELDRCRRVGLARQLAYLVAQLEKHGCSHRDLSAGNVFIDAVSWTIYLIDFDSLFHQSLVMPTATTGGTAGYCAPFIWHGGVLDPRASWCPQADRFSLALLCVEFLTLNRGGPLTADGGMFDQNEIRRRGGAGIRRCRERLVQEHSGSAELFDAALAARRFSGCPSPDAWMACLATPLPTTRPSPSPVPGCLPAVRPPGSAGPVKPPRMSWRGILAWFKPKPAQPQLWIPPALSELPSGIVQPPQRSAKVSLPPDPWRP